MTFQIGADTEVRARGATQGRLGNSVDRRMPRAIDDHWPVFAFNKNLGRVGPQPGQPFTLVVGHVREPAVSYVGKPLAPLWRSYWPSWRGIVRSAPTIKTGTGYKAWGVCRRTRMPGAEALAALRQPLQGLFPPMTL